jgi:hypothetical protein
VRISVDPFDDGMSAEREPVSAVLVRAATELTDLADRTERLQDVMAALVQQMAALDHNATQDMQALDWIAQHLEGIASFLDAIAKAMPPGWRIDPTDALDALTLAELAHRLRGAPVMAAAPAPVVSSGDMELF